MTSALTSASLPRSSPLATFIRRGGLAIAICVILGALAGFGLTKAETKKYTATASLQVSATGVDNTATLANARTSGSVNLDTEAQIVKSSTVAAAAQKLEPSLGNLTSDQLIKNVVVSVPANTSFLKIAYTAKSPALARDGANAFANAYLNDRKATAQDYLAVQIKTATRKYTSVFNSLTKLSDTESGLPAKSPRRVLLDTQRSLYGSQLSSLNSQLTSLESTQVTPGRVLTEATVPTDPSSPSSTINIGSGLAVGLLVGLFIAWLRSAHRRKVRGVDDLMHRIDLPAVASVQLSNREPDAIVGTQAGEVYRRLATLLVSTVPTPAIVVIAGAAQSRSDRAVAANLAATLADGGTSVRLLRVADLDAPKLSLTGIEVIDVSRAERVRIDVGGHSMSNSLTRLRGGSEILIIDAPCPTRTADAPILAVAADAVLLVVEQGTRTAAVRASVEQFDTVGAPMLGTVLTRTDKAKNSRERVAAVPAPSVAAKSGPKGDRSDPTGERSAPKRDRSRPKGDEASSAPAADTEPTSAAVSTSAGGASEPTDRPDADRAAPEASVETRAAAGDAVLDAPADETESGSDDVAPAQDIEPPHDRDADESQAEPENENENENEEHAASNGTDTSADAAAGDPTPPTASARNGAAHRPSEADESGDEQAAGFEEDGPLRRLIHRSKTH